MKLTVSTKIKKNPRLITKKIGQQVVILDPVAGEIRSLNEVAGFIWQAIGRKTTVREISQKVFKEFTVSPQKAKKDTLNFLEKYLKMGLIQLVKPRPPIR